MVAENGFRSVSYPVKARMDSNFLLPDFTSQKFPSTDSSSDNYPGFTSSKTYPPSDFMLTNRRRDETNDNDTYQLEGTSG
jgi:hypothetical protein